MSTKKKTTTKTTTVNDSKYYIVLDHDNDVVCQGEWKEIVYALEDIMDGNDDSENRDMLANFTLYELNKGKSLKYKPSIPASVEL